MLSDQRRPQPDTVAMSEHSDPIGAPRDREKALSAAYLRLLGSTQAEAAMTTGVDPRTLGRWESCSWWPEVQREAADRWLAGAIGKARRALLRALDKPDGALALKILERVVPELAPAQQRIELGVDIRKLNFEAMTDEQLARIAAGEHPYAVLAATRDVHGPGTGEPYVSGEILLPPPQREDSED